MSIGVTFNGQDFVVPETGEKPWGDDVTSYLVALSGALSKAGGTFILTADVDFGGSYGLITLYVKSESNNIATAGFIRAANTDAIEWRNSANNANLILKPKASTDGILTYDTHDLVDVDSTQTLTNKTIDGAAPAEVARLAGLTGGTLEVQLGVVRDYSFHNYH